MKLKNYLLIYRKLLFISISITCFISCKSKTNQIVNHKREGKWITIDTLDYIYIAKGKFHKDNEIGTWRQYCNGKLVRKEKYHKETSSIKYYYPNGKIMKRGHTKSDHTSLEYHWYYYGKWYFYNASGKLDSIKTYKKENITDTLVTPK